MVDLIVGIEGADSQNPLQRLLRANRGIVSKFSLTAVLGMIVEVAAEGAGARYVALGVVGADGSLEHFVHRGMDEQAVSAIGREPKIVGLIAALIESAEPIRLSRISEDHRSVGFPPGHPPMDGFLGAPIRSRDQAFGCLYLGERRDGGEFTEEDEDLVVALAATAGMAIENARLFDELGRRREWLRASSEVSGVLLAATDDAHPLQLIVDSVRRLADADVVTLVQPAGEDGVLRVVVASGDGEAQLRGMRYAGGNSLVALVMEASRGKRVASIDDEHAFTVHLNREFLDIGAALAVPLSGKGETQGAIVAGRRKGRPAFTSVDLEMAEAFAIQAALARELVEARANQQRLAVLEDRDRIARDLHDHVIQRLFAAGLSIQAMSGPGASPKLSGVVQNINDTISQLRTSIFDLQAPESTATSLKFSVLTIAEELTPPLGFEPTVRFEGPLDTLIEGPLIGEVEAIMRETLTNVVKHACASEVTVRVKAAAGLLSVTVADNGVGLSKSTRRSGPAQCQVQGRGSRRDALDQIQFTDRHPAEMGSADPRLNGSVSRSARRS